MIIRLLTTMKINKKLVLASKSPRRFDLLSPYFDDVIVVTRDVEEKYLQTKPEQIVVELAKLKLADLPNVYYDDIVISGDTIVWYNGSLFGKPKDSAEAYRMLNTLSGKKHYVYSGFAVSYKGKVVTGVDKCEIIFKQLSDKIISDYISTGSPLDKAGAYGVQDGVVVDSFCGDINTIIGLPVDKILDVCKELLANG